MTLWFRRATVCFNKTRYSAVSLHGPRLYDPLKIRGSRNNGNRRIWNFGDSKIYMLNSYSSKLTFTIEPRSEPYSETSLQSHFFLRSLAWKHNSFLRRGHEVYRRNVATKTNRINAFHNTLQVSKALKFLSCRWYIVSEGNKR